MFLLYRNKSKIWTPLAPCLPHNLTGFSGVAIVHDLDTRLGSLTFNPFNPLFYMSFIDRRRTVCPESKHRKEGSQRLSTS